MNSKILLGVILKVENMRENRERTKPQIMKTQKKEQTHTNPLTTRQNNTYLKKGKGSTDRRMDYRN